LFVALIFSLVTQVLVIYLPVLQTAFHTSPLSGLDWLVAIGIASTLLVVMELVKLALRANAPAESRRSVGT
jgi:hypothetical protein